MCGRYALAATVEQLAARFGAAPPAGEPGSGDVAAPRYNLAPGQGNPVVVAHSAARLTVMQWGLVPAWAKAPKTTYSTINARIETVAEKAAYRTPLRRQRCLVPATGYYEWQVAAPGMPGPAKQPYHIQPEDGEPGALFAFAGLYDVWHGPDGRALTTYAILTTEADPALAPIHARMPVIVPRAAEAAWLDPALTDATTVLALLTPPEHWHAYPVSLAVNNVAHDTPELIRALA